MPRRLFPLLAAILVGVSVLTAPVQAGAAPTVPVAGTGNTGLTSQSTPTGCTTSIEWVQEGSSYYYGRGKVQCATGRYGVKLVCRNLQTGVGYVRYGTTVVTAPNSATAVCDRGNTAESVHAVQDPPPAGLSGCATWMEWVHDTFNTKYYGRGLAQCDTGSYNIELSCRNIQTGQTYLITGYPVTAPSTNSTTCYRGHRVESVRAVPQ